MPDFLKNKKIIAALVLIILIGSGSYWFFFAGGGAEYSTVEVSSGEIVQKVSPTGTVKPAKEITLQTQVSGTIKNIYAREGEKVKKGDVLLKLKASEIRAELMAKKAALASAEAALQQALDGTRAEEIEVTQKTVEEAKSKVESKKQNLKDIKNKAKNKIEEAYEDVPDLLSSAYYKADDAVNNKTDEFFTGDDTDNPQITFNTSNSKAATKAESQRHQAQDILKNFKEEINNLSGDNREKIRAALSNSRTRLEEVEGLLLTLTEVANSAITSSSFTSTELANYKANLSSTRTEVNTALTNVVNQTQLIEGTRITNEKNISTARSALESAKTSLSKAKSQLELKKSGSTESTIDLKKAGVQQARANLSRIREKLQKYTLRAPMDGIVTRIPKEEGEVISPQEKAISMMSSGPFQIEANVSEAEIAKVEIGDPVEITLDAFGPEKEFKGRVVDIDTVETVVSGVIYYQVTVEFNSENKKIKSGMTANLEIQTEKKKDAFYLPYYVIQRRENGKYVRVLKNGKMEEQKVKTGLEGENRIEILSGIKKGDEVIFE